MVKVWVCFESCDYEGCSEPKAAFDSEDKAKAWCVENAPKFQSDHVEYKELEVK